MYSFALRAGSGNTGTSFDLKEPLIVPGQWYHIAIVMDYNAGRIIRIYVNGKKVFTSPTVTDVYPWRDDNSIMIGGNCFDRAGLDGLLDEFQLYNTALTDDEVLRSMRPFSQSELPAGLIGYWNFEENGNELNQMKSVGTNKNLVAALEQYADNNPIVNYDLTYGVGAPFIPGTNYRIETTPEWKIDRATVVDAATNDQTSGNIKVKYGTDGKYTATLTLANGWGTDTRTFEYITVKGKSAIDEVDLEKAYSAFPNPFINEVYVKFEKAGAYTIAVYSTDGKLVFTNRMNVDNGQFVRIPVSGDPGIYYIQIKDGSKILNALKVIKK
jgi:hypothetical protein